MDEYSFEEIKSILIMQSFGGLSLLCIYVLMGLGLYVVFGQMGIINMAHAEFLVIGSYTMCLASKFVVENFPQWIDYYLVFGRKKVFSKIHSPRKPLD